MIGLLNSEMFWLLLVNVVLGLAVLVCCLIIGWYVIRDIRQRARQKRDESRVPKDYLSGLKDLGITMNDGGKKIDESQDE
jgi:hypothetical protein